MMDRGATILCIAKGPTMTTTDSENTILMIRRLRTATLVIGATLILMNGCTVGPSYTPPTAQVPAAWLADESSPAISDPVETIQWWQTMYDPVLNGLIERAVEANHDLRIAEARVHEARAQRAVVTGENLPQVNATGSYSRSRRSENTASGGAGGGAGPQGKAFSLYQAGFDASWELDFFGRIERSVEAADAGIDVAVENRRDVLLTLLADVARSYVDLRQFQRRLSIANENIRSQKETVEIAETRFHAGVASELNVAQAKAQLATTTSQVPVLESSIRQSMYSLAVLLGREPGALVAELETPSALPDLPPRVPIGLPSDLLRRRPDIRAAERHLAAATADIGVATAELFPRFSLTGNVGFAASDAAKLFNGGSLQYSFGPSVTWPIFAGGRIRGNIAVQNARQEQAIAEYDQTVIRSLADVESALVSFWKQQSRRDSLGEAVTANRRAVELANELYTRGLGDFLNVLESQRSLYQAEDQLVQSDRDVRAAYIALYKALGGGWEAFEPVEQRSEVGNQKSDGPIG